MSNAENDPKELIAKALDAAGLIDYQESAVVSRTIINKDNWG